VTHVHSVQLFDSHESAAHALTSFVTQGFANGDQMLLVTRLDDWNRAAVNLTHAGAPISDAIGSGQLDVRDSLRTLNALLVDDMPAAERFENVVANLVRQRAAGPGNLRVYGDMVDLLAAEGRFNAAARLEELWNSLRDRFAFTLFCGYSSNHFCGTGCDEPLQRIRRLHSDEYCDPEDFVANQLMETTSGSR
jgi:hypothetical protein